MPEETSSDVSASRKAIGYAEVRLAVHDVYKEVMTSRSGLEDTLHKLADLRGAKRLLENSVIDREMDLTADERSRHPEMSDAALGRHLKVAYHTDPFLINARMKLGSLSFDLDSLEMKKNVLDTDIKIAVARMNELGGYLSYLAAVKIGDTASK